ncbi:hypothetical protein SNE35_20480 [Paucibacter sp. R3-3]|uniref:Uncharacterized protein n=1 Tax=Roseateles agri TaxID=3098619 RepID=A0ABU5DKT6_9BURK|nr:hypothetical protein [Paucibacter sp. R3-3]
MLIAGLSTPVAGKRLRELRLRPFAQEVHHQINAYKKPAASSSLGLS